MICRLIFLRIELLYSNGRKEEKEINIDISQTDKFEILRILRAAHEEILTAQKKESAMGRSQKRKESNINDEILSQKETEEISQTVNS